MGREFDREAEAGVLCEKFEAALARVEDRPEQRVLYLIWRDPWMTISPETYISRTLGLFNWRTVTASTDERYPEVDLAAVDVDRVLLSSEPFHFKEHHIAEVKELVPGAKVSLIDGEMTSWYGSRAIAGIDYLAEYTR
jgi:ABC-type Fe3+-hydroxamate transport system substrate-binding protein